MSPHIGKPLQYNKYPILFCFFPTNLDMYSFTKYVTHQHKTRLKNKIDSKYYGLEKLLKLPPEVTIIDLVLRSGQKIGSV